MFKFLYPMIFSLTLSGLVWGEVRNLSVDSVPLSTVPTGESENVEKGTAQPSGGYIPVNTKIPQALYRSKSINWVSLDDIKHRTEELDKGKGIVVGFDIDDTLLACDPIIRKQSREGDLRAMLGDPKHSFWEALNCSEVEYCMKKKGAESILNWHKKRGDKIFLITAREPHPCLKDKTLNIQSFIEREFDIELENDIVYTGFSSADARDAKTNAIRDNNINIFYGDSDHDITGAINAGAQGVRILRNSSSFRKGGDNVGKFSEWVLVDSDY